jgi:hypothetical protein
MRKGLVALAVGGVALLAGAAVVGSSSTSTTQATPSQAPPAPLVIIYMENKERTSIIDSSSAPWMNTFADAGINFSNYYGVSHPSLPNYLAFANGSTDGKVGTDSIRAGELPQKPTIWNQLQSHNISWGVYEEGMPSPCYAGGSSGRYQLKHNPAIPFATIFNSSVRCKKVQPFSAFNPSALRQVSFITPDMCNDMHDCSVATGNGWLEGKVPPMLAAGATVVITFDEGSSSRGVNGTSGGGLIYTAVDGVGIAPRTVSGQYNHYSLLAAIEQRFGLSKLGAAKSATPLPLS